MKRAIKIALGVGLLYSGIKLGPSATHQWHKLYNDNIPEVNVRYENHQPHVIVNGVKRIVKNTEEGPKFGNDKECWDVIDNKREIMHEEVLEGNFPAVYYPGIIPKIKAKARKGIESLQSLLED